MPVAGPIPDDRKVDHLILLVGGNPLPNAVAGRLLLKPGGRITLVHSAETHAIAQRLDRWLEGPGVSQVELRLTSESVAGEIEAVANKLATPTERTGLNYTGGTKAMAVHMHRALVNKIEPAHRSYLDSRSLRVRFDDGASCYAGLTPRLGLASLMELHKELHFNPFRLPSTLSMLPATAGAVARQWRDADFRTRWFAWFGSLDQQLRRKVGYLYPYNTGPGTKDEASGRYQNWARADELRGLTIPFPPGVESEMREELHSLGYIVCGQEWNVGAAYDAFYQHYSHHAAQPNQPWIEDLCEWFKAGWLENHVFACLTNLQNRYALHSILLNVHLLPAQDQSDGFELDVVALRGYQLFGISCTTAGKPEKVKPKMYEIMARLWQLGGEEAQTAVVTTTYAYAARGVEEELSSTMGAPVRVFGLEDLSVLPDRLAQWIEKASGDQGDPLCVSSS